MRKVLGGGMRQTGVLTSACLYALTKAEENLSLDHSNAKKLAQGIEKLASKILTVDSSKVETNIVHVSILAKSLDSKTLLARLANV
jgi:threonine aldolase